MLSGRPHVPHNRAGIGTLMVRLPGGQRASSLTPLNMIYIEQLNKAAAVKSQVRMQEL
jgi:hypothetical protein